MAVLYESNKPYLVRVPTITDVSEKIKRFGLDNLYPQKAEALLAASLTLGAVVDRIADFVAGEGFIDPKVGSIVVNNQGLQGQTLNKVLIESSKPFVVWKTICLHFGYNMNFGIATITPIPFQYIRFGLRNPKTNKTDFLAYSTNWERDGRKEKDSSEKFCFYPTFNPDPGVVQAQIEQAGGIENYKGQILYLTPRDGEYTLATFDCVFEDAQTQSEIGIYKVSNIQNSFLATMAIMYPGEFGSKQEEIDFNDLIANKKGSRNAGSRIGLQDKTGLKKVSDMFMPLTPVNIDKLFELTESTVKENIIECYGWPKILQGITNDGLFAQQNIEEAYTYANSITRNKRSALSEVFSYILKYWGGDEGSIVSDCAIKESQYLADNSQPGQLNVNDNIKNMSGMQSINFARILRKYEQGSYTRQLAHSFLQQGFGLGDDEINKLLDSIDEITTEDGPEPTPVKGKPAKQVSDPAEVAFFKRLFNKLTK